MNCDCCPVTDRGVDINVLQVYLSRPALICIWSVSLLLSHIRYRHYWESHPWSELRSPVSLLRETGKSGKTEKTGKSGKTVFCTDVETLHSHNVSRFDGSGDAFEDPSVFKGAQDYSGVLRDAQG